MPGAITAAALQERARVSGHTKSQMTHLPRSQGTTVTQVDTTVTISFFNFFLIIHLNIYCVYCAYLCANVCTKGLALASSPCFCKKGLALASSLYLCTKGLYLYC